MKKIIILSETRIDLVSISDSIKESGKPGIYFSTIGGSNANTSPLTIASTFFKFFTPSWIPSFYRKSPTPSTPKSSNFQACGTEKIGFALMK